MAIILDLFARAVGGIIWFIDKCMKRIWKECTSSLPPFRIQLKPSADASWTKTPDVQRLADELAEAGFAPAGVYDVSEMPNVRIKGWVHEASSVLALVYCSGKKIWMDMGTHFADESVVVTTLEDMGLPQRPNHPSLRANDPSVRAMHQQILQHRGAAEPLAITSDLLAPIVEQNYAAHQNWLAERGGYTAEEICRVILKGRKPDSDEVMTTREVLAKQCIIRWWSLQPNMPCKAELLENTVVVVHDEIAEFSLEYTFSNATGDWDAELKMVPGHRTPRERFALLNRMRGEPLVKIYEKTTPLAVDFYIHRACLEEQEEEPGEEYAVRA